MSTIRSPSLFKDIILLLTYTVRRFKRKRVVVVEAIIIAVVLFFTANMVYMYTATIEMQIISVEQRVA